MLKIRKLGILKMALFSGLFSFFIGLISAILIWAFWAVLAGLLISIPEGTSLSPVSFSLINLILFPLIYGILGFIFGLIFTPIMNLVFKIIGGLDIIIEEPEEASATQ